ncbi:MAG: fumarylacetoacetate hydrolase family protein [Myxococcales bacterium]|nr:fumarylacetoacetate hydrolase family protein [Myxococcales bacterium]
MKLATRDNGTRDGELIVASRDGSRGVAISAIAPTLQALLDDWALLSPRAEAVYAELNAGPVSGEFAIDMQSLRSPLPRAYGWIDGSAYINHIVLVRKARGALPPATLETDPLVYQGGSDTFLDPRGDIPVQDLAHGPDFESEITVVTDDLPMGTSVDKVGEHIKLVMLCNDVTLRSLIPAELAKSFGFYCSKPSTAFSPFAVTPDEFGDAWRGGRMHLPLRTWLNGERFGDPEAGPDMHFSFHDLLAHACKTRTLSAGTIVGSGTVSNTDRSRGSSCLAEQRMLEKIDSGEFVTPFLKYGDTVRIEMTNADGDNLFGTIEQTVVPYEAP